MCGGCLQVRALCSVSLKRRSHPAPCDAEAFATPDVPFNRPIVRQHRLCLAPPSPGGERREAQGAPALLTSEPRPHSLPMRPPPPVSPGTMQRGVAAGGSCWGQFESGSGVELDLPRDHLLPRLQVDGQGCDPRGITPRPGRNHPEHPEPRALRAARSS